MHLAHLARAVLEQAVADELVNLAPEKWNDPEPRSRTDDELRGVVSLLKRHVETDATDIISADQYRREINPGG